MFVFHSGLTWHISDFWLIHIAILCSYDLQRPISEQKELLNKWNEMGTDEPGTLY